MSNPIPKLFVQQRNADAHQRHKNEREDECFEQLVQLRDERENQHKKNVDDRIHKKPADEQELPFFGRFWIHGVKLGYLVYQSAFGLATYVCSENEKNDNLR